jgi:outer membrane protein assembly factor BamB
MRITFTLTIAVLLATTTALAGTTQFRGDPQHSGLYDGAGVPQFHNVKWKFHTNGQFLSSPAIADGTVFIGSTDGSLYAVDQATGAQKWKFATRARVTSSPAVESDVVYFGSFDGAFYAVDAKSGQLKWKFATAGERRYAGKRLHGNEPAGETMPDPFDFYLSSPAVANGVVYFGSGDGNVYALDAASGAVKWKVQTGDVVHASPAVASGVVYVGSWDSYFYALDAATGAQKWRFKTGEDPVIHNQVGIQSSATVADGVVYFGCRDSKFYAVDAASGQLKWSFDNKGSWVIASPAVRDGRVYFATSDTGLLNAVDAGSGAPVFSLPLSSRWPMFSSPALAGDTLFIGSNAGKLFAVDLKAQRPSWAFATDGARANGPALTKPDGTPNYAVMFVDNFYDNMVIGVAKQLTTGSVLSSPVVAGNVIYFGSADGNLYALS